MKKAERMQGKLRSLISNLSISVEPILFCISFASSLSAAVSLDLLERNVCVRKFNMTISECSGLTTSNASEEIKTYVEKRTAQLFLACNLVQGLGPLVLALFLGSWTDANGRKPFIISSLIGYLLSYILWASLSFFPQLSLPYFVIPSVPISLTGGMVATYICAYSYLSDLFPPETRTLRFNISVSCLLAGSLLSNVASQPLFSLSRTYGYLIIFIICAIVIFVALLYAVFILQETVKIKQGSFLFDYHHLKNVLDIITQKPLKEVFTFLLIAVVLVLDISISSGEHSVLYLIGKTEFSWTLGDFNMFSAVMTSVSVLSPLVGMIILRGLFNMANSQIIMSSCVILFGAQIVRGLSKDPVVYWIASGMAKVNALITPTVASELANTVSPEDLGKLFSLTSLMEASSPFIASPTYALLYSKLLPNNTLYVFFASAGLSSLVFIFTIIFIILRRQSTRGSFKL